MRHIGFTGTRHGMTAEQYGEVAELLAYLDDNLGNPLDIVHAHHGDCIGADVNFHTLAEQRGWVTVGHLPIDTTHQAFCSFTATNPPLKHMQRNAQIVKAADVMIACPYEMTEQDRGGTWRTIGMARKAKKPLAIVMPDGSVQRERWP